MGERLTEQRLQQEEFFFAFRRRVGLVFQNADVQLFNPSVFDELAFGPLQLRWPAGTIRARVSEVLQAMDIAHLQDRAPHRLSGGEKKRVALASVLVLDPEVLLLDEPSAALDPSSQARIVDFLISCGKGAKTVVISTHDMDTLEDIADRCYVFPTDAWRAKARRWRSCTMWTCSSAPSRFIRHPHVHVHGEGRCSLTRTSTGTISFWKAAAGMIARPTHLSQAARCSATKASSFRCG